MSNFRGAGHRVLGIEPTDVGQIARARGIETVIEYFTPRVAEAVRATYGPAKIVTATNVFAHIEDVGSVITGILAMLDDDGIFVSELHYLIGLLDTLQYDTVYHEHLRYYSVSSPQVPAGKVRPRNYSCPTHILPMAGPYASTAPAADIFQFKAV